MSKGIYKHPIGEKSSHWKGGKPKCVDCGKELSGYSKMKKNQRTKEYFKVTGKCRKCFMKWFNLNHPTRGSGEGNKTISKGYIYIRKSSHPFCDKRGYIFEHRLIVEECIGRYLNPCEIVHHINNNRSDNQPKNLYLFSKKGLHGAYHNLLKNNPDLLKPILKSNII